VKRKHRRSARRPRFILGPESLEDRTLLSVNLVGVPNWIEQGPGPITGDLSETPASFNNGAGAIEAVAIDPSDPNIVVVGTVNGGIWRTTDAQDTSPTWTAETDQFPSLSIDSLTYSPIISTPGGTTDDTIYAGTGASSSTGSHLGALGLLKSTDNGVTWAVEGVDTFNLLNITSVVPTALTNNGSQVVLAATTTNINGSQAYGVYRSPDSGQSWQHIAVGASPNAGVSDLVGDPSLLDPFYAAVPGQGIFRSTDAGVTWLPINNNLNNLMPNIVGNSTWIRLSVSAAGNHPLYASLVGATGATSGIFRFDPTGQVWTRLGTFPFQATDAANPHSSLVADPKDPNIVYAGAQGQVNYGSLFVWNSEASPNAWSSLTDANANDTAPHADSRNLAFEADGNIVEVDDGGIYRLQAPGNPANRKWVSIDGNIAITEFYSVAYDPLNGELFAGSQDNGAEAQSASLASPGWTQMILGRDTNQALVYTGGDGSTEAVDASDPNRTIRYTLLNSLQFFYRSAYVRSGNAELQVGIGNTQGVTNAQGQSLGEGNFLSATVLLASKSTPNVWLSGLNSTDSSDTNFRALPTYTLNTDNPSWMLIGQTGLYESMNQGDTISNITPVGMAGRVSALAYGGVAPGIGAGGNPAQVSNPYVALVGDTQGDLFLRTSAAGAFQQLVGWSQNGGGTARDIIFDPANWQTAYITDGTHVFMATGLGTGADKWSIINGNLSNVFVSTQLDPRAPLTLQTLALIKTGGHDVLLVGAQGGVYRLIDPSTNLVWSGLGAGLPNDQVTDIHYIPQDDLLVIGTLGRGAWELPNAGDSLTSVSQLQITFSTTGQVVRLVRDAANPLLLDVIGAASSTPMPQFRLSVLQNIQVTGNGSGILIVDSSNGAIGLPGGITYNGNGGSSQIQVQGAQGDAIVEFEPNQAGTSSVRVTGANVGMLGETISYSNVSLFSPMLPLIGSAAATLKAIQDGLMTLAPQLKDLTDAALLSASLPVLGTSLADALNGQPDAAASPDQDPTGADVADDAGDPASSILERLIETGAGGFSMADIGTNITTLDDLRAHLLALDPINGQVTLTQDDGVTTFDVLIHKNLSGQAILDAQAMNGKVDLSGTVDVSADVTFHLIFGVDSAGFFIDPISTLDPVFSVSNIQIDGVVQGAGQFGFAGVDINGGTLQVDPAVNVTVSLGEPVPDPVTGKFDHRLRLSQLDPTTAGLVAAQLQGGTLGSDVVFTPTLDLTPLSAGLSAPFSLGNGPAEITLTWASVLSTDDPTIVADNASGQTLDDFLNLSSDQIIQGLADLATSFQGLATLSGSVLGTSIAITGSSLGTILNSPVPDVTVAAADVADVSPVFDDGGFSKFVVELYQGDLPLDGVAIGDTVTYKGLDAYGVSSSVQGEIDTLDAGQFTVRYSDSMTQTPDPANRTFTIAHSGSLTHQIQAALGGLLDPQTDAERAPTLQGLILALAGVTGADPASFGVSTTGSGDTLGVQFSFDFQPQPLTFQSGLNLGSIVTGLNIANPNDLAFTIGAQFHLVAGLLLSPNLASGRDRLYLAQDATPALAIHVQAAPTAPISGTGTLGYLNVDVRPDNTIAANPGVTISGTLTTTLTDPGTEAADGRIGRAELHPTNLSTLFASAIAAGDPLVVSIPGLLVDDTVGTAPLAPIRIAIDGSGAGRLTTLAQLQGLATTISVENAAPYAGYINLNATTVVQALTGLAQQLGLLNAGGGFGVTLPLIGHSLASAIDLGKEFKDQVGLPAAASIPTLQDLLTYLAGKLGIANVSIVAAAGELDFVVSYSEDMAPQTYSIGLGLGSGLGGLVSAAGSGLVTFQAHSDVHLAFDIGLGGGNLYDEVAINVATTRITASAVTNAGYNLGAGAVQSLSFTASLGPLPGAAVNGARVLLRPEVVASLQAGNTLPGKVTLSQLSQSSVVGALTGDAEAVIPISVAGNNAEIDVKGLLAQVGSTNYQSSTTLVPNTDTSPEVPGSGFTVLVQNLPALLPTTTFDPNAITLQPIIAGLGTILGPIHDLLDSNVLDKVKLPLIGSLGDAAKFITDLEALITTSLDELQNSNPGASSDDVKSALLTGLNSLISGNKIVVQADSDHVQFDMDIHETYQLANISLATDIGIPGLNLHVAPGTNFVVNLPLDFAFGFGYSKEDGAYFDTNAASVLGLPHTFTIGLNASLVGLNASGMLGFLGVNLTPVANVSPFTGGVQFNVDVKNPVGGDHLSAADLAGTNAGNIFDASVTGGVDAAIHLQVNLSSDEFPGLGADLMIHWSFTDGGFDGNVPDVSFDNVTLNLGTFFSGFVAPIISQIQSTLGPLKPIFDLLEKPLPIISDLKGSPYTLLDASGDEELKPIVDIVDTLLNLKVPTGGGDVGINLGSFDLGNTDVRNVDDLTGVTPNVGTAVTNILNQVKSALPGDFTFLDDLSSMDSGGDGGIQFPLLENPELAFNLLLGKPVDLFDYTLPNVDLVYHDEEFFPILGPLGVNLVGDFEVHTRNVTFGYDTAGFMESPVKPLDGFFVSDDATVTVHALIEADAELNLVIAQAGVGGGIRGDVTLTPHDPGNPTGSPGGKLRLSGIETDLEDGPLGLFNASGDVEAFLHAYIKVGFTDPFGDFIGWQDSKDLARVVLLDFNKKPAPKPVLGSVTNGVLTLDMGPNSGSRANIVGDNKADGDEAFTVTRTANDSNDSDVTVKYLNAVETFTGVTEIYAEGGMGNNTITIDPDVKVPAILFAAYDPADPRVTGGNLAAVAPYTDIVTGGGGPTSIYGGAGTNQLNAGPGDSRIYGGSGNNTIHGGAGLNLLVGGAGDNQIYGGTGVNTIFGGVGSNFLQAGTGMDTLIAGSGGNVFQVENPATSLLTSNLGSITIVGGGTSSILQMIEGAGAGYTETYTITSAAGDPTIVTSKGNVRQTIHATGLTAVLDTVPVDQMTYLAPSTFDPIDIVDSTLQWTYGAVSSTHQTEITVGKLTPISFSGKADLSVIGGQIVSVNNPTPADGLRKLTVDGGATIDVLSTAVGVNTIVLDSSGVPNVVIVGNLGSTAGIRGPIVIGAGSSHPTFLVVDDSADPIGTYPIITDAAIIKLAPVVINFVGGGLSGLSVYGGTGGNVFHVIATGTGFTTAIEAGAGGDIVDVGSLQWPSGSVLDIIHGNLTVLDAHGGSIVNVDDTGATAAMTGTLTASTLSGLGMSGIISYLGIGWFNVRLGSYNDDFTVAGTDLQNTLVDAGPGNDIINIQSTGGATTIDAGEGDDIVNVGSLAPILSGNLDLISGPLTVDGGPGSNVMNDDDTGSAVTKLGKLTSTTLTGLGMAAAITYGDFRSVNVRLGSGGDTFTVASTDAASTLIAGGPGDDTIDVLANNGDTLIQGGGGNDTFVVGSSSAATARMLKTINFPLMLDGGSGSNRLVVTDDADFTLSDWNLQLSTGESYGLASIQQAALTGGTGDNTFDVSAWTGAATLNGGGGLDKVVSVIDADALLTDTSLTRSNGSAFTLDEIPVALISGGPSGNRLDATEYSGMAWLYGGAGNDVLIAGSGDDYLDGGTGHDSLTGGAGSDALVGINGAGDTIRAGSGDAQIYGSLFVDSLYGGAGSDLILGEGGNDFISGGPGDDTIWGGTGNVTIHGGGGNDVIVGGGADVIDSEDTAVNVDYVYGSGHDKIVAGLGNDVIFNQGGTDVVSDGGPGTQISIVAAGSVIPPVPGPIPAPADWPPSLANVAMTLPTGVDTQGRWTELSGSASGGGLSNSPGQATESSIAAGSTGEYVAWTDSRDGQDAVYVARNTGSGWQELAGSAEGGGISGSIVAAGRPSITLDASGQPLVAFTEFSGTSSDIEVARYDPTANGGQGGWVAFGTSLAAGGISDTGAADDATIVETATGPVVAWLDGSSGVVNVYVKQFVNGAWVSRGAGSAIGAGVSGSATNVVDLALATDGTKVALAWTQVVGAKSQVYLRESSGGIWNELAGSASGSGLSNSSGRASAPSLAYDAGSLFAAWQDDAGGANQVDAVAFSGGIWKAAGSVAGGGPAVSHSLGGATSPVLAANDGRLYLAWLDNAFATLPGNAVALYSMMWNGSAFVEQVPGDARAGGIDDRLGSAQAPALAVEAAGHPFVSWTDGSSGSAQIFVRGNTFDLGTIHYVNDASTVGDSFSNAVGQDTNDGLSPGTPKSTIQAVLNDRSHPLHAGDIILVDSGIYGNAVDLSAVPAGVLILGSTNGSTTISGPLTATGDSGVTLSGLTLTGGVVLTGASQVTFSDDSITGTGITLIGGMGAQIIHDVITVAGSGITMSGGVVGATIEHDVITASAIGIAVNGAASGLEISDNRLASAGIGIELAAPASGHISGNAITASSIGVAIDAVFTGPIEANDIRDAAAGVRYQAGAAMAITGSTTTPPGSSVRSPTRRPDSASWRVARPTRSSTIAPVSSLTA
jgi:hypothetical protein